MDIVIAIPKSEYLNDDIETEDMMKNDLIQFWTLYRKPKKLNIGDRVYFIKNNKIESSMRVINIIENSTTKCLTTGRVWKGVQIFMDDLRYENIDISVKGFQGFRYKWW